MMKPHAVGRLIGASVLALSVGVASVASAQSVTLAMSADYDTLDPHKTRTTPTYPLIFSLYDRLVAVGEKGDIVPALAESWKTTPDSVTAKIRKGVTCSDGSPITAEVVARSMKRLAAPETAAPYASRTFGRAGQEITNDAESVTIKLNAPNSDLLLSLAMPWSSVVCAAGLDKPETLQTAPVGSGPYALAEAVRGDRYVFKARQGYTWGPEGMTTALPDLPKEIRMRVVTNMTTAANLLLQGEINLASISGRESERLGRDGSLIRLDATLFGTDSVSYHAGADRVTGDVRVRKALSHAVDGTAFNRAMNFGLGMPLDTLTTPSMQCYDKSVGGANLPYDVAKAKALLAEAGWKPNAQGILEKDGKPLVVRIAGSNTQNAGPEYLMESYRALGIDAKLTMGEFNTWLETLTKTTNWDVFVNPLNSVMPSPTIFVAQLSGGAPPSGSNIPATNNEAYTKAAQAALAATQEERCAKWAAAERELLAAGDIKPLSARVISHFSKGVKVRALGSVILPWTLRISS
jgi:peptide/nickel transport system substrate-binding protein